MVHHPPARHLPLKPRDFHILVALGSGPLHGYGIMKAVEEDTAGGVTLELGSLYRLLGRLTDDGLLEVVRPPAPDDDPRRRYYALTALGRAVARGEALRLRSVLASDGVAHLLGEGSG